MNEDTPLRLLVLMRHAEAKGSATEGDMARELTKKGRRTARRVGEWLLIQGVRPDTVVASPSVRTVQTWEEMHEVGLDAIDVWTDAAVYDAAPEDLIESVQEVDDEARTVLLLGHAPGIPALAATLEDHTEADSQGHDLLSQWPAAGVAVVSHRGTWSEFPGPETAVALFHAP